MEEIKLGLKLNEEFTKSIKEATEEETIKYEIGMEEIIKCIIDANREYMKEILSEENAKKIIYGNTDEYNPKISIPGNHSKDIIEAFLKMEIEEGEIKFHKICRLNN